MNTPLQGTAADIIKKAMVDVDALIRKEELESKMILQVHDELVFEVCEKEISIIPKLVQNTMSEVMKLRVPLKVSAGVYDNWGEAK